MKAPIVERLRAGIGTDDAHNWRLIEAERDMSEAADTITDLLAALKRISRSYENQNINHVDFRVNAKNIADAAIAKAKGGAA